MTRQKEITNNTIQSQVIRTLVITFIIMLGLLYFIYYFSMQTMLVDRENDNMLNQVQLAENVLLSSVNYLPSVTRDWSSWDNTYEYISGDYDEFLEEYLTEYPFQLFRLNFLTIIAADGSIVYERFYNFWETEFMDPHPDLSALYQRVGPATMDSFREGEFLDLTDTTQIGRPGFVCHQGQIYYLSAYPVLRSDETGPCIGTFIFGRIVDQAEINFINANSGLQFSLLPLENLTVSEAERNALLTQRKLVITGEDHVVAYAVFDDLFGEPNLLIAHSSPRTLYQQGLSFIFLILAVIALCCSLVLWIVVNLLRQIVVKPLGSLVDEVNEINLDTISNTLEHKGKNRELDCLTTAVNSMLHRIEEARDTIEENNAEVYFRANHDTLTGLLNRFSAQNLLTQEITQKQREMQPKNHPITLYFLDLDRFKLINDTLGHSVGDQVIKEISKKLLENLGDRAQIARTGGDEFFLLVHHLHTPAQRKDFAHEIIHLFNEPYQAGQRRLPITVSIGSSYYPQDGFDAETLIKNGEIAMFQAKELGEGLYMPYHIQMQIAMQEKVDLEQRLRQAVQQNCQEFTPYFQPILNIQTGQIQSCEALMRWITPERMVSPLEFIPAAEASGLILPLSWWMIQECCKWGRKFAEAGLSCSVSINASAQVLLHHEFLPVIQNSVQVSGMDITKLDMEIVEATLVEDVEKVNLVIKSLHALGIELSVDDFGTGYSSLSYLYKLALDRIKIDASFVSRIGLSEGDRAIVQAIVAMAKRLNMKILAEGVETENQLEYLKEVQCEEIQGYLISKPLPGDEFIRFVKQWNQEPREA